MEFLAHKAVRRNIHDNGAEGRDQVKLAFIAQPVNEIEALLSHHPDILLHCRRFEPRHNDSALAQILIHLGKAVEIRREHLEEERHGFADRKQLVCLFKKETAMFWPEHDIHPPAHYVERKQPALALVALTKHTNRIPEKWQQMS